MTEDAFEIFSETKCKVGEGPIWHPDQNRLIWFDILGQAMFASDGTDEVRWDFDEVVSAAGVVDAHRLLVATESGLILFDTRDATSEIVKVLEADAPERRSNDGRADRQGGFWFSTMGKAAEAGFGRIYRYWKGEVRLLVEDLTIPNAICFSPAGDVAYYADTPDQRVLRLALDPETGWPVGAPDVLVDLREAGLNPDGAIVDAAGTVWVACWGVASVIGFDAGGNEVGRFEVPTPHASCPGLGGVNLDRLFVASATHDLPEADHAADAPAGKTFCLDVSLKGLAEPRVIL
ncbi:MAG: SMP-30/gluconolactonase/LRE family protein [Pseudomonadota bacterium]|nr:SMP-30/gluconolactonase/LRE family protein [Pseudomonadota bacterium]